MNDDGARLLGVGAVVVGSAIDARTAGGGVLPEDIKTRLPEAPATFDCG